jgi:hypothetical protein
MTDMPIWTKTVQKTPNAEIPRFIANDYTNVWEWCDPDWSQTAPH